ncbi:hypothetical protein MHPYR_70174 [uncultured Mycobacterium sp.]|uniref:Uncharacterized protein n=1 Tax=uncultured Mycobacterium sp. TaxID=171292 RepID=A0A1Y5PKQ0_9MYCO|nr:hypothetical protein MHPYR_70174 [uncultured Mycobacterium sp.]
MSTIPNTTDTNPYHVDSTSRTCCGGIGRHTCDCTAPAEIVGARRDSEPPQQEGTTMTVTSETTWRDLVDQLTPRQIAGLEDLEQLQRGDVEYHDANPDACREWLVGEAREYIAENERDAELNARIQPPANTTLVGGWDSTNQAGKLTRSTHWAAHDAGPTSVDIDGWQDETGTVDGPHLSVYGLDLGGKLNAADARRLAEALVAAADELERLK